MTHERQEEIVIMAEKFAHEFNSEHLSIFPFKNITQIRGDVVFLYSEKLPEKISAAIDFLDEKDTGYTKFAIIVNRKLPEADQYYSTAHAFGHYFLHPEEIKKEFIVDKANLFDVNGPQARTDKNELELEQEANYFAMALLMPKAYLLNAWEKLRDVDDCAQVFNVPVDVMAFRLRILGLI